MVLAELKTGEAFGEEALVSDAKRNATVTALSDGDLLRVGRKDFNELLREPLLKRVPLQAAAQKVRSGALWLDVRYPSEYQYDKLPGAINVPLAEVRNMFAVLDRAANTSPIARAAGAAPRRHSSSRSAGSVSGSSKAA